jgi:HlyD family secretion protein
LRHRGPASASAARGLALLGCLALTLASCRVGSTSAEPAPAPEEGAEGGAAARAQVTALGRLEPGDGVVDLGGVTGERVTRLAVHENDLVVAGQELGELESHAELRAELEVQRALVAEATVGLRRAREFGPLEIRAQEAEVRRLESELALAASELRRAQTLGREQVITEQELERRQIVRDTSEEAARHAAAVLERERQRVRIEEAEAAARLAVAEAREAALEARLERSVLRAPVAGQVVKIFVYPGEAVGAEPVLQIAESSRMTAVAEVYETDAALVRVGQPARISSPALGQELDGVVERVGSIIFKNDVLGLDPTARTDSRVVEVRIRLADSELASRFNHLQVDVAISVGGAPPR